MSGVLSPLPVPPPLGPVCGVLSPPGWPSAWPVPRGLDPARGTSPNPGSPPLRWVQISAARRAKEAKEREKEALDSKLVEVQDEG